MKRIGRFYRVVAHLLPLVVGFLVPFPYLAMRRSRRQNEIRGQLADVLELMARATRAGESLEQAIGLVGDKAAEPPHPGAAPAGHGGWRTPWVGSDPRSSSSPNSSPPGRTSFPSPI